MRLSPAGVCSRQAPLVTVALLARREYLVAGADRPPNLARRPHSFGEQEAVELRRAVQRWHNEHPELKIEMSE